MDQSRFFDFGYAMKNLCTFRKLSEDKAKINWRDMRWLQYKKEFGTILFKTTLTVDEPFRLINIRKRGVNRIRIQDVPPCYTDAIHISDAKKKDLLSLLPLIDTNYHSFYKSLKCAAQPDFHPDLTEAADEEDEL